MACYVKVNRHGRLAFRLFWDRRESWEGTRWKDTPKNRLKAEADALRISEEIDRGDFDYLKWFPEGNKADLFRPKTNRPVFQTIRQYYADWISAKVPPLVKKSRARKYRSHFKVHILPFQGDVDHRTYGMTEIRKILIELVENKKLAVKTAKNVLNASLRAFFRDAKAEGLIPRNPFDDLPRKWWPKTVSPEPDPFSEEERDRIIDYFFKKYWATWPQGCVFLYSCFWVGSRPSELTGRRWRDFDPVTGKLSINTSLTEGEEGPPKTDKSIRTIELLEPVVDYLRQIKPLRAQPNDYIFFDQRGNPIRQEKFGERHFQGALTALKIRHRDFYHCRHTFISVMLSHGENPKRIAEYVGNSPEVIFRSYGKWIGGHEGFGKAALEAAKTKPKPKPYQAVNTQTERKQGVGMVRGGGFEPPRHFWH
jgi:integrase